MFNTLLTSHKVRPLSCYIKVMYCTAIWILTSQGGGDPVVGKPLILEF